MKLIFATGNEHKIKEVSRSLSKEIELLGLSDVGIDEEIPEDHESLEDNALQKARYVFGKTGEDCFADDTGLEVEILQGEPGVYSARYAGPQKKAEDNIHKLLENLQDLDNRKARFRTVIALIFKGKEYLFEGICNGVITTQPKGHKGFGYDPVFMPNGFRKTFGEMSLKDKNLVSHRARAVAKLSLFLKEQL
ncbi:MAG TPA: non-canonical purine NTP pyrophosphatase, RdgB/HAM1 family [Flavobacteriales bacterium]|jgi:XTP/dITP diphosphohydrolase|nr:non-canonical purine NTP pyrophosphatase, RdgB/HAM1 family [Flavobacteriales bacterium]